MTHKRVLRPMKPEPCLLARIWIWYARMYSTRPPDRTLKLPSLTESQCCTGLCMMVSQRQGAPCARYWSIEESMLPNMHVYTPPEQPGQQGRLRGIVHVSSVLVFSAALVCGFNVKTPLLVSRVSNLSQFRF